MKDKGDVKTEKDGQGGITVKLDIPDDSLARAMQDGLHATLVAGAVNYVMKELTPELLKAWVEDILKEALRSFSTYELERKIREISQPMVTQLLDQPDVRSRIRMAVSEGVEQAITAFPEKVKEAIVDRSLQSLREIWKDYR